MAPISLPPSPLMYSPLTCGYSQRLSSPCISCSDPCPWWSLRSHCSLGTGPVSAASSPGQSGATSPEYQSPCTWNNWSWSAHWSCQIWDRDREIEREGGKEGGRERQCNNSWLLNWVKCQFKVPHKVSSLGLVCLWNHPTGFPPLFLLSSSNEKPSIKKW